MQSSSEAAPSVSLYLPAEHLLATVVPTSSVVSTYNVVAVVVTSSVVRFIHLRTVKLVVVDIFQSRNLECNIRQNL